MPQACGFDSHSRYQKQFNGDKMKRALVVDDNRQVRELLTAYVEHTDKFDVVDSVESGEEAMELFEPGKYTLIILDVGLISMSGIEVAFLVRKEDKEVIVVAITGYVSVVDKCDMKDIGFDKCFLKPVDYVEFFDYIRDFVN
jgi:DNA-binding response OmpR family regulator